MSQEVITVPEIPVYVVQRASFRSSALMNDQDYLNYLTFLSRCLRQHQVLLHAYCLFDNQVHLLMTPRQHDGVAKVVQQVSRQYKHYLRTHYRRRGDVWQSRYTFSMIQADTHLLAICFFIEKQPIDRGVATLPEYYRWSSYRWHVWGKKNSLITDHAVYEALGVAAGQRQHRYRDRFKLPIPSELSSEIRTSLTLGQPLGGEAFRREVARRLTAIAGNKTSRPFLRLIKKHENHE